jgi:YgiT-type zinc finger domain-containing protein
MTTPPDDLMDDVRRDLAAWHQIHPRATFAEMETAVEQQIEHLRAALLQERADATRQDEHPACPHCGTTMTARSRATRTVILPGEEQVAVERAYVVCPACGTGLFPPG